MFRFFRLCAVLGLMIGLCVGCEPRGPERVAVEGEVSMDGKAVDGASIAFVSVDGKVLATAVAGSDGKFFIKAGVGKNKVTVSKADPKAAPPPGSKQNADGTMPAGLEVAPPPPVAKKKVGVPEKYSNPDTSGLAFDIQKGMEPISISISSK